MRALVGGPHGADRQPGLAAVVDVLAEVVRIEVEVPVEAPDAVSATPVATAANEKIAIVLFMFCFLEMSAVSA